MSETTREDLEKIIALLEKEGEKGWAMFFSAALNAFNQGDYRECADSILSGSGGSGSLDDLVLGQGRGPDGGFAWKPDCKHTNGEFQDLLVRLRAFALDVRSAKGGK